MKRDLGGAARSLLRDESGQTMLEYVVIMVFVIIVMFITSRLVGPLLGRQIHRTSLSIEQG
jgi:Flp pilus assembly pilin Flp